MSFNLVRNPAARQGLTDYSVGAATGTPTLTFSTAIGNPPDIIAGGRAIAQTTVATQYIDVVVGSVSTALVNPGTTYTFSVFVRGFAASTLTGQAIVQWIDGGGSIVGTSAVGTALGLANGVWSRVSATGTAPGTAVRGRLTARVQSATNFVSGEGSQATGFMLEAASPVNSYYDGNTPNYMWVGSADLAPSWGPVVTVVANPLNQPPRNEVTLTIPPGYVMQTAALNRWADSTATPVRTQPAAGFDTRVVYDYEMPYDTSMQYELITDCFLPGGSTVWDETWANLSSWSGDTSQFTVSGGTTTYTSAAGAPSTMYRNIVPKASYRVTVSSLAQTNPGGMNASNLGFGIAGGITLLSLSVTSAGKIQVYDQADGQVHNTSIAANSPVTIDFLGTGITVSGLGGSWSSAKRTNTDFNRVLVGGNAATGGTFTVGEVVISSYPPTIHADVYSPTVAISPLNSWMIHPGNPGLSLPISSTDRTALMIRSIGDVVNPSAGTDHTILGQSEPITTVSGPRYSPRFQLVLGTRTRVQEQALVAMLQDGTPLLFRFPASFPVGMDEGFYSVGDVTRTRFAQRPGEQMRNFTLPLTGVQSPVVTVQNTGWSWAALAAQFTTWAQVAAAFNTWADVAANNRKAGY